METVTLRGVTIDNESVKICIPIVARTEEGIFNQIDQAVEKEPDMIEFRSDWYDSVFEEEKLKTVLQKIREKIGDIPLLFTFRTFSEGGEKTVEWEQYKKINCIAAETELVDLVDVQLFFNSMSNYQKKPDQLLIKEITSYKDDFGVRELIQKLHQKGVHVLSSYHDFKNTPSVEEIVDRLCVMQEFGADIVKIAVMPSSPEDVLHLFTATQEMNREHSATPFVTISMGELGVATRMCGGTFGNAITFATAALSSAPGQVPIEDLRKVLSYV